MPSARSFWIAHEACAYYRDKLRVEETRREGEQRRDLRKAAEGLRRLGAPLSVSAFFARRIEERIRFERVPV